MENKAVIQNETKKENKVATMVLAAMFLALSYVMPFLTGQIPEIGSMLCPMHIPVLLCGYFCGWKWGICVGFLAPLFRSMTLGMPPIMTAVCMAFELATYGGLSGFLYGILPGKKTAIYGSLIPAMIGGRLVWGVAMLAVMGISGGSFGLAAFFAGAVGNALPGIALQIVLIPLILMALPPKGRNVYNRED